jgi:alcohol dehydrogenase class IV
MTSVHRHAVGVPMTVPRVRPAVVLNDPALCASQPVPELAASAGNALGHAAEGPITPLGNPVAALAALEAARLLSAAFVPMFDEQSDEPDRDSLALGALLAGYVIGSTWYGLHHVLSQTLVRFADAGHGQANTIMLQHTLGALERRSPLFIGSRLAAALGSPPAEFAHRLARVAGAVRLRDVGVASDALAECVSEAAARPDLAMTPPPADRDEIEALYAAAW